MRFNHYEWAHSGTGILAYVSFSFQQIIMPSGVFWDGTTGDHRVGYAYLGHLPFAARYFYTGSQTPAVSRMTTSVLNLELVSFLVLPLL